MSTNPRDYAIVNSMSLQFNSRIEDSRNTNTDINHCTMKGVACYGVHPWFLHQVLDGDDNKEINWLVELRQRLINDPCAIVGEIGLDGARWRVVEIDEDEVDDNGNDENDKSATISHTNSYK